MTLVGRVRPTSVINAAPTAFGKVLERCINLMHSADEFRQRLDQGVVMCNETCTPRKRARSATSASSPGYT
jgi:hypothetical protein